MTKATSRLGKITVSETKFTEHHVAKSIDLHFLATFLCASVSSVSYFQLLVS
jgi:hypothetical protein